MKKIVKKFFIVVFSLLFVLFISEYTIWHFENKRLQETNAFPKWMNKIGFHTGIKKYDYDLDTFAQIDGWGRAPVGLEFKKKKPVVIFGGSYSYGFALDEMQTVSSKLSKLTKRPVYNKSFVAWGIQHLLFLSKSDKTYSNIKNPEYVFYIFTFDDLRRMYLYSYSSWNILNEEFDVRYKLKGNKLFEIRNTNNLFNQIKRLYTFNELHHLFYKKYVDVPSKRAKAYDLAIKQINEAEKEIKSRWKNTKFVVLSYDDPYFSTLLEKNGISTVNLMKLASQDKFLLDSMKRNVVPTPEIWDELLPKLVKSLKL